MAAKISSRNLTKHLAALGQQVHTVDDEGNPITREEALARLLWDKALGFTERVRDDEGTMKEVVHKPEAWAMQAIWDRREGKTPMAIPEDEGRVKAADKVRDLAKQRLNGMAAAAAGVTPAPAKKGPPQHKPKPKQ